MLNKTLMISSKSIVAGVAFGLLLATSSIIVADDSPFESIDLEKSYLMAGGDTAEEAKGGEEKSEEGSCGGDKGAEASDAGGTGEEGSCGGDKGAEASDAGDAGEEGSCGGDKGAEASDAGDKGAEG